MWLCFSNKLVMIQKTWILWIIPRKQILRRKCRQMRSFASQRRQWNCLRRSLTPEIPVNVYDLGLIYRIEYDPSDKVLHVDMTLTAPSCPAADFIMEDVRQKLVSIEDLKKWISVLCSNPSGTNDMMTEEAKLELDSYESVFFSATSILELHILRIQRKQRREWFFSR